MSLAADAAWLVVRLGPLLLIGWLLLRGLAARVLSMSTKIAGGRPVASVVVFSVVTTLGYTLVGVPFLVLEESLRRAKLLLAEDQLSLDSHLIAGAGAVLLAAIVAPLLLTLIRLLSKSWWFVAATLVVALTLLTEMPPSHCDEDHFRDISGLPVGLPFGAMAERFGFDGLRVVEDTRAAESEMSASIRSGDSAPCIVVSSRLLEVMDRQELEFVAAHELAHLSDRDDLRRAAVLAALIVFGGYLVYAFSNYIVAKLSLRLGFNETGSTLVWPLLLLLTDIAIFCLTPCYTAYLRHRETRADSTAARMTQNEQSCRSVVAKVSSRLDGRSSHLERLWNATHPSRTKRLRSCKRERGQTINLTFRWNAGSSSCRNAIMHSPTPFGLAWE